MQLNSGILERRRQNWAKALHHFEEARRIEPTYCEPDYWVGATKINAGLPPDEGLKVLQKPFLPAKNYGNSGSTAHSLSHCYDFGASRCKSRSHADHRLRA